MQFLRHLPRFRIAYRSLDALAQRESWSRAEIESLQLERLNAVWRHAVAEVPYYRHLSASKGLPPHFRDLQEFRTLVPVLPKTEVRAEPRKFLSERAQTGVWRRTGGSTGMPMSAYWGREAYLEVLRTKYRYYAAWGLDILHRIAYLWGHSDSLAPGWAGRFARVRMPVVDLLRSRLRLSAYHLGRSDLLRHLTRVGAFQPISMYGYSKAMGLLAAEAEAIGFHCDSLKLFTLTGEPAFPYVVEKIEQVFQVPATVEYGAVECGVMATEQPDRTLRVREDIVMLETLPREDGRFEIVVTVLNNPSFPLLRYALADVTDGPLVLPERGFAILKNVAGRNNDFVITCTGRYLHSSRFDALLKYHSKSIRGFRVRQRADGSLAVQLALDGSTEPFDVVGLESSLRDLVEGYPVKVEIVDAIPQTAAGKHRLVMSQLTAPGVVEPRVGNADARSHNGKTSGSTSPVGSSNGNGVPKAAHAAPVSTSQDDSPRCPGNSARENTRQGDGGLPVSAASRKAARLRSLICGPGLSFLMEAHNGLSAKIAEEAGFEAIWASGLAISASLGVRDSNEASWTQVLEVLEFMSDATRVPILVDGDTGYGNFNSMRRLVAKLEQRNIGGV